MDIQAYIQSGIIESYVLGMASNTEVLEVERLRTQHPEIQKAIDDFSDAVEEQAMANAIAPPPELKHKILSSLPSINETVANDEIKTPTKITAPLKPIRTLNGWKIAAAASIFALVVSIASNVYFYTQYNNASNRYQALLNESQSLQASNNIYQTKIKDWQTAAQMMANPGMVKVTLAAVPGKENTLMTTLFWEKSSKDVYVLTNKLPEPPAGHQYQLWALVDGKPVDAGMIDPACEGACKMKNIQKAQAFAITLEKKGGSSTPTMQQMFVMGTV